MSAHGDISAEVAEGADSGAPPMEAAPADAASGRKRKHDEHAATEDLLKHPVVVKVRTPAAGYLGRR